MIASFFLKIMLIAKISQDHLTGKGAQMTIMSSGCAKKCNLIDMIDPRFSGVAQGQY